MLLVAQVAQEISMPQRLSVRKLGVAKAFTRPQLCTVGKSGRGYLLAPFYFDGQETQNSCVSARHVQFTLLSEERAWRVVCSAGVLLASLLRHRFAPHVTCFAAKGGVSPRPRGKAADPVVDLLCRVVPIEAAVFFL